MTLTSRNCCPPLGKTYAFWLKAQGRSPPGGGAAESLRASYSERGTVRAAPLSYRESSEGSTGGLDPGGLSRARPGAPAAAAQGGGAPSSPPRQYAVKVRSVGAVLRAMLHGALCYA